jgi:hypothetical protein
MQARRHLCGSTPYLGVALTTPILTFRLLFGFVSVSFSFRFRFQFDLASSPFTRHALASEILCVNLAMSDHGSIIKKLEEQRLAFENIHTVPTFTAKDEKRWKTILKGAETTPPPLSQGRRSIRTRAQRIATTVLQSVGPDVLLLVLSSLNQDILAKLDRAKFVVALRAWWDNATHPKALTTAALKHFVTTVSQNAVVTAVSQNVVATEQDGLIAFGRTVHSS